MKPIIYLSVILCVFVVQVCGGDDPQGHLQPLGSHQAPERTVESVDSVPSPYDFFHNYVLPGKPVVFKGAAKEMPAYSLWTDEYLSKKFGSIKMDVEEGKKENRSWGTFNFKLQDFIKRYKEEDIYMVESLPKPMREEYMLLRSLGCGGFTSVLQDAVMWFSSGGTKSVLHFDAVENINCLFSGSKKFVIIDKKLKPQAHIDRVDGSFSSVDVEKVDMYKFPGLRNIPWFNASMEEGDCLYIPFKWLHHVRSFGNRNLAINIWWAHFSHFNKSDCERSDYQANTYIRLSDYVLKPHETTRQELLEVFGRKPLNKDQWLKYFKKLAVQFNLPPADTKILEKNFKEVDANGDGIVTAEEVFDVKSQDIQRLLSGEDGEGEGESDEEDSEEVDREGKEPVVQSKEEEKDKQYQAQWGDDDEKQDSPKEEL